jgi:NitT/TauT family transport system substrate-binding protein
MNIYRYTLSLSFIIIIASIALVSCSQDVTPTAVAEEPVTLRIAVLPILDALPMYVAQQEGLFEEHGVKVEFIPVASAAERDQVITSGQADGMINEAVSTLFYNQDETQIQIVRFARVATPTSPQFFILASGQSGITNVEDLQGVAVGISEGTVIEYLTDRLLEAEGFTQDEIQTIAVPKIPERMTLLSSGELDAAMLPDPLSSLAVQGGAVVVLDDSKHPEFGYSTISFRKPVIETHPQAVKNFLAAVEEATLKINSDPTMWEDLLTENKLVPAPLMGTFKVPPYPSASIPSKAQWDDALDWVKGNGLIDVDVSYEDSVTGAYLP